MSIITKTTIITPLMYLENDENDDDGDVEISEKEADEIECNKLMTSFNESENVERMQKCLFEFVKISKQFPPQKNENKFIYGKLGEIALINTLKDLKILNLVDLDKRHKVGSEYKNDIQIENTKFSVKVKLNKVGDIIMINCKSKDIHTIDVNLILIVINEKKIYIIPRTFDTDVFIKRDAGSISYKGKILTFIEKYRKDFIYKFPELSEEQNEVIKKITPFDIYNKLYLDYICLNNK